MQLKKQIYKHALLLPAPFSYFVRIGTRVNIVLTFFRVIYNEHGYIFYL